MQRIILIILSVLILIPLISSCSTAPETMEPGSCRKISERCDSLIKQDLTEMYGSGENSPYAKIMVDVSRGRVLLTGQAEKPQDRVEAVSLAWKEEGVKEVINEVEIIDTSTLKDPNRDIVIVAQVRGKLLMEKKNLKGRYTVDSINGIVYLNGRAENKKEAARVSYIASRIQGVKKVVNRVL